MGDGTPMREPVPLTTIGGFLGAGKTTLLNRVLAESRDVRYAVLVNDFGELAIDGALVTEHGGDTITFANGCVCCTLGDSLLATIDRLLEGERRPEQFLVEASGVADPQGIADLATLHPELSRDLVIVLADAQTLLARAADARLTDTVERQIAAADLVVLNRCDRASERDVAEVRGWLDGRVRCAVVETAHARLPLELLRAPAAGDGPGAGRSPGEPEGAERVGHPRRGHEAGHGDHDHGEHDPDQTFRTVTVPLPDPVDPDALARALDALRPTLLRAKGFVRPASDPDARALVELSGRQVTVRPWATLPGAAPTPALVAIGLHDLPSAEALARALGGPPEPGQLTPLRRR